MRFYASQPHYAEHLRPIVDAIGGWPQTVAYPEILPDDGEPVVIAGMADAKMVPEGCPIALVSHGADQTYVDLDHASYAGGRGRERVGLFLCPSQRSADMNLARYPDATAVVTGPARLDCMFGTDRKARSAHTHVGWADLGLVPRSCEQTGCRPTVVFAWHWDATIHPETRSAVGHYADVLARLPGDCPWELLGHAHPRAWETIGPLYERLGIEPVWTADEALLRADLLVADNTSLLYDAAALDIPTLTLDAPWYRDQPRHGLRFYDMVPGLRLRSYRAQAPDQGIVHAAYGRDHLAEAITEALEDRPELADLRRQAARFVYEGLDGHAGERSAAALETWGATL